MDLALAVLQGLRATLLDHRLLKALLVAGAPLRLAIAANIWAGRSLRWAWQACIAPSGCCNMCCRAPPLMCSLHHSVRLQQPPARPTILLFSPPRTPFMPQGHRR